MNSRLKSGENRATITNDLQVLVSRKSLETEHRQLVSRLQELRRILGYPPLLTGKARRRHETITK